jgi:hypothetical protein
MSQVTPTIANRDACIAKPYRSIELLRGLETADITTGTARPQFPPELRHGAKIAPSSALIRATPRLHHGIAVDLQRDSDFEWQPLYATHGIVSTLDVVIKSNEQFYGMLKFDNDELHDCEPQGIQFPTRFANILACKPPSRR